MKLLFRLSLLSLLLPILASCGGKEEKLDNDDTKPAASAIPATAETPLDVPMTSDNIIKGDTLYQHTCAPCHGPHGKGDGPAAAALNPKPRDHSNGAYMDKLTNRHIHDVIKMGGAAFGYPTMPGQPQLTEDQLVQIISFVRTLSPTYKQ